MLRKLINSRWFALAEIVIVLGSGAIWYFFPEISWRLLGLALLPGILRMLAGQFPFKRTAFDIPITIFVVVAAIAAWAGYDSGESWAKFWLILAAVLLFYALADQPRENFWLISQVLTIAGLFMSVYFLLAYDWLRFPVKVYAINLLGIGWMSIRPPLNLPMPDLDSVSGTLFILLPFSVALLLKYWQETPVKWLRFSLVAIASFVIILGMFMAAMTEAGVTILITLILLGWWKLGQKIAAKVRFPARLFFTMGVLFTVLALVWVYSINPNGVIKVSQQFPVFDRLEERLSIAHNSLDIFEDYLLTGVGLASFPGTYSKYALVIPFFFIPNSYNFFIQLLYETGVFGFFAYLTIFFGIALGVVRSIGLRGVDAELRPFSFAVLAGFWVALVIGLFDVVLFSEIGTIFMFVLPGLGVAMIKPSAQRPSLARNLLPVIVILAGAFWVIYQRKEPLPALFYANTGAIEMTKQDLRGWTIYEGENSQVERNYALSSAYFNKALQYSPRNRTAHYRLGLIELREQNFEAAVRHLERAYESDPHHRGIQKNLGYAYVWLGKMDQAARMLAAIPEASYEMSVYAWWWGTLDRSDLSNYASEMSAALKNIQK